MRVPVPGELFVERYRVRQHVGAGAFGDVLLATDESLGRDVAIKCLSPGSEGYAERAVGRFEAEAKIVATLQHPNTVRLFDHGQAPDGLLYMVFEYVEGVDLATWLSRGRLFQPHEVLHIIGQVLAALMEAHNAGVLHRDIKPANIIAYEYAGDPLRVKLLDFGIAKFVDGDGQQPGLTGTGAVVGTPRYMSPEQVCHEPIGPPSDIYSLGLVGVELLGGTALAESFKRDCLQAYLSPDRPPPALPGDIAPPPVRDVLRRMCDGQLQRRLPSAVAVRQILDGFRKRTTTARATASAANDEGRWKLLAVALVAFVAVAAALFLTDRDAEQPPADVAPVRQAPAVVLYEEVEPVDLGPVDAGPQPPEGCDGGNVQPGFAVIEKFVSVSTGSVVADVYVPPGYDRLTRNQAMLVFGDVKMSGRTTNMFRQTQAPAAEPVISDIGLREFADTTNVVLVVVRDLPTEIGSTAKDHVARQRTAALKRLAVAHDKLCLKETIWLYGHGKGGAEAVTLACSLPGVSGLALSAFAMGPGEHPCPDRPPVPTLLLGHVNRNEYVSKAPASGYLKGCRFKSGSRFGKEPGSSGMLRNQPRDEHFEVYTDLHGCADEPEEVWADDENSACFEWACATRFRSCHLNISIYEGDQTGHQSAPFFQECYWRPAGLKYTKQLQGFFGETKMNEPD